MPTKTDPQPKRRPPLTRTRIVEAAVALADEQGIEALSMRKLGRVLGVEAMSLYNHVSDKDDLLDGMADHITDEFEAPTEDGPWRDEVRRSAVSAHAALLRHPWASAVLESRTHPGPARLRYLDAVVGALRRAGFGTLTIARALTALDSHTYGFALQESAWPIATAEWPDAAATARNAFEGEYPNLMAMAEMAMAVPGEKLLDFEFGLDLILDGLERLLDAES
jgi:AcrR family transcriptional regulator